MIALPERDGLLAVCSVTHPGFEPDHLNYAFLQNQDRHVHLHVSPRYAARREVAGLRFEDPDYPDHYAVPAPARQLTPAVLEESGRQLRP